MFDLDQWLEEHSDEDLCTYCIYDDECPHGVVCYGGPPIEPKCACGELLDILDIEAIQEDYEEQENE